MLAGVSHDLRTPLTKLQLALAMLSPNPADADLLTSMERQLVTIDGIVGQFIDYARVGSGEAVQTTDLNALLARTAQACHSPEQAQHLDWQPLPPVAVRPQALTRLLANLLENARRYAPGPISLSTRLVGDSVEISLQDSGPGVAPEHLTRVQQPFERLDSARSGHPGAGLGLAIVERVVRLHHGSLHLGARDDGHSGLQVRVRLPRVAPPPG
jgi:two-component system, OmpR family, osmolarity sensor histidine kinase EnvZ